MQADSAQQNPKTFRIVAQAALVAAVFQISLGGIVRVTGSGLGCPDWPLCHGQVIPPFVLETWIEWSHRLSASLLGLLVLAAAIIAWRSLRRDSRVTVSTTLALVLVFIAAALGGITVRTELEWWARLIHLGVAEGVATALIIALVATGKKRNADVSYGTDRFGLLVAAGLAGSFTLILAGSYVVGQGYGSSCGSWPLCNGRLFPDGTAFAVHMSHRYLAVIVGLIVVGISMAIRSRRNDHPDLWKGSLLALAIFAAQVLVGAAIVWSGFDGAWKSLHLTFATLLWASLSYLAAVTFIPWPFAVGVGTKASFEGAAR